MPLQKYTTRSSIGFAASHQGGRKNLISLLPGESSATDGLRYQLYASRFAAVAGLSADQVLELLPPGYKDWSYDNSQDPDWQGYQGFIATREEVDRLSAPLRNQ